MHKHKYDYADNLKYCAWKENVLEIRQIREQVNRRVNACKRWPNQNREANTLRNIVPPNEWKHAQRYKNNRQCKQKRVVCIRSKWRYLLENQEQNRCDEINSDCGNKRHKHGNRTLRAFFIDNFFGRFRFILLAEQIWHGYAENLADFHYRQNIGQALPRFP